jgi:ADP-ribosylglycohydrolase
MASNSERILGAIFGGAIGDAFGGAYEGNKMPVSIDYKKPWRRSDDTQMTLATLN